MKMFDKSRWEFQRNCYYKYYKHGPLDRPGHHQRAKTWTVPKQSIFSSQPSNTIINGVFLIFGHFRGLVLFSLTSQLPSDQAEFKNRHRQSDSQKVHTAKLAHKHWHGSTKSSNPSRFIWHALCSFSFRVALSPSSDSVSICHEYDVAFW